MSTLPRAILAVCTSFEPTSYSLRTDPALDRIGHYGARKHDDVSSMPLHSRVSGPGLRCSLRSQARSHRRC